MKEEVKPMAMSQFARAEEAANRLCDEVMNFLGATDRNEVQCPRERSYMTPCIARDGGSALADDRTCVGCRADPHVLLRDHLEKHPTNQKEN